MGLRNFRDAIAEPAFAIRCSTLCSTLESLVFKFILGMGMALL